MYAKNARVTRLKPRQLGSIQTSDQVSFRRSVILAHGGNPDLMPEFTDPNWASDNSKLISFDIETFGDITHPEDKVDYSRFPINLNFSYFKKTNQSKTTYCLFKRHRRFSK